MVERGLVEEVQALEGRGLRDGVTASRALGYAQLLAWLDGRLTIGEAISETARATRRFVRRQRSWFGRDPRIRWLTSGPGTADEVVAMTVAGSPD
jgi:tRNA dimethylallyltransferase